MPGPEDFVTVAVPEVEGAPAHVAEDANKHTPDPETPPVVDKVPAPEAKPESGLDELRTVVTGLAESVATLTNLVMSQNGNADEKPHSLPWTHRGGSKPE